MNSERNDNRFSVPQPEPVTARSDESLVNDTRAGLTPAQMVERKLASLLPGGPLPVGPIQGPHLRPWLS